MTGVFGAHDTLDESSADSERQRTVFDETLAELNQLCQSLRSMSVEGTLVRDWVHGLARDVYILEQSAQDSDNQDDAAWMLPHLEVIHAKVELGQNLMPGAGKVLRAARETLRHAHSRTDWLFSLRSGLAPLLFEHRPLREQAQAVLDEAGVEAALRSRRLLRRRRAAEHVPPEISLSATLLEALTLHLALQKIDQQQSQHDSTLKGWRAKLRSWLTDVGAEPSEVTLGSPKLESWTCLQGGPSREWPRSTVMACPLPNWRYGGQSLCEPIVVISAGSEPKLIAKARELIKQWPPEDQNAIKAAFQTLVGQSRSRVKDSDARTLMQMQSALELLEALWNHSQTEAEKVQYGHVFQEDWDRKQVELLVPIPGTLASGHDSFEQQFLHSETPKGHIISVLRPGLRWRNELIQAPLVTVSAGPAPASVIDELLAKLPMTEAQAMTFHTRISKAVAESAHDQGRQLSRELGELSLRIADWPYHQSARLALEGFLAAPPTELQVLSEWNSVHEMLTRHLKELCERPESPDPSGHELPTPPGMRLVQRLIRPYIQALRVGQYRGLRLRSLGESLASFMAISKASLAAPLRSWCYQELDHLSHDALNDPGHLKRFARTVARSLEQLITDSDGMGLRMLVQSLEHAQFQIWPNNDQFLGQCSALDEAFHRLELSYDNSDRGTVLGHFRPAVAHKQEILETGQLTLSLGPKPRLLKWLESEACAKTCLAPAQSSLISTFTKLDNERAKAEWKAESDSQKQFIQGLSEAFKKALTDTGWQRSNPDRRVMTEFFEVLREDYDCTLLPAYLSHNQLKKLIQKFGASQVKLALDAGEVSSTSVTQYGCLWRDRLLTPLNMTWTIGEPPEAIFHFRERWPWFQAVLDGEQAGLKLSPESLEAIHDFESPDANSLDAVVASLSVIAADILAHSPDHFESFCQGVESAPGLDLEIFPKQGQIYSRQRLQAECEQVDWQADLTISLNQSMDDGQAVSVERVGIYQKGRCLSRPPKAQFSVRKLSADWEKFSHYAAGALVSDLVPDHFKAKIRNNANRLALSQDPEEDLKIYRECFLDLHQYELIDTRFPLESQCEWHQLGSYLSQKLQKAKIITIDHCDIVQKASDIQEQLGANAVKHQVFGDKDQAEIVAIRQPFVKLEDRVLQKAMVVCRVITDSDELKDYDHLLNHVLKRLQDWKETVGQGVEQMKQSKQQSILASIIQSIQRQRQQMFEAYAEWRAALPQLDQREKLLVSIVDRLYQLGDLYTIQGLVSLRQDYQNGVFQELRDDYLAPYLLKHTGLAIDQAVQLGADVQTLSKSALVDSSGPQPSSESHEITSIVWPCYRQQQQVIRPALVRTGVFHDFKAGGAST